MNEDPGKTTQRKARTRRLLICLAIAAAAPVFVLVAVIGVQTGLWTRETGYRLLTLTIGPWIAGIGVLAALFSIATALKGSLRAWGLAALAILVSGATVGLYLRQIDRAARTAAISPDVNSNPGDAPGYSREMTAERERAGAVALDRWGTDSTGCAITAYPSQSAPGAAAYALQQAGFEVNGLGVGRADGTHTSLWFGFEHDAVVRIRPGRTDVRVTARADRPDGGEACRLALRIRAELQPKP